MMPLNPVLSAPSSLLQQVSDWYPEEADPVVVDDLRTADFRLVSLDLETTGLNPLLHQATEVSWYCLNSGEGGTFIPPHTLENADPYALEVSKYHERLAGLAQDDGTQVEALNLLLGGDGVKTYLIGSNPGFDAGHIEGLYRRVGLPEARFNHRKPDVAQPAYWLNSEAPFGIPTGLKEASAAAGVSLENHHEAWEDTVTAARLWHTWERVRRALPPLATLLA